MSAKQINNDKKIPAFGDTGDNTRQSSEIGLQVLPSPTRIESFNKLSGL
jgi:hypothetical protein